MRSNAFENYVCGDCRIPSGDYEVTTEGGLEGDCPICKKHSTLFTFRIGYLRSYIQEVGKLKAKIEDLEDSTFDSRLRE